MSSNIKYQAAGYVRISKSGKYCDGDSISSQKKLIQQYTDKFEDICLKGFYEDEGFTGTDFERPGFLKMFSDITSGKINCIIVKDLSRLGRDYIWVGQYLQVIFPAMNVRFIAVLDDYDSENVSEYRQELMLPFKNFINDIYCRDISRKVKSRQNAMRKEGLCVSAFVPYGYLKSEDDHHYLKKNIAVYKVVKTIFYMKICEYSNEKIAGILNDRKIPSPMEEKIEEGNFKSGFAGYPLFGWSGNAIKRIIENDIYIGRLTQGKTEKISYKLKKTIDRPRNLWYVRENSHEAIVDSHVFYTANRMLECRFRSSKQENAGILRDFDGYRQIIYCGMCGAILKSNSMGIYKCSCNMKISANQLDSMLTKIFYYILGRNKENVSAGQWEKDFKSLWDNVELKGLLKKILIKKITIYKENHVRIQVSFCVCKFILHRREMAEIPAADIEGLPQSATL